MKQLKKAGLFGRGLVHIDSPLLIDRYNRCLHDIGSEQTKLKEFSIDGMGWSPDIADEMGETHYLSHGNSIHHAIILTPKQYRLPVYTPFHSFDRALMTTIFKTSERQIADLTSMSAIWVEIDSESVVYQSPLDLLMIDSIVAQAYTPDRLIAGARQQRELVRQFNSSPEACLDIRLLEQLVQSKRKYGDLRERSIVIPDIPFGDVRTFYTRAFDGVYVFRDLSHRSHIIALEDKKLAQEYKESDDDVFFAGDKGIIEALAQEGLLEVNPDFYLANPGLLDRMLECITAHVFFEQNPDGQLGSTGSRDLRMQIVDLKNHLPPVFGEIQRFKRDLERGDTPPEINNYSDELFRTLCHPSQSLDSYIRPVVWKLLSTRQPMFILRFYSYDLNRFICEYKKWPARKRKWAVERLSVLYEAKMDEYLESSRERSSVG